MIGRLMFGGETPWAVKVPPGEILVKYGGGVNTIALLALLRRLDVVPRAIVMADPGSEWPETLAYRDQVAQPWLASIGFPPVTVVSRQTEVEGRVRPSETLAEECYRIKSLPAVAFGKKKCSDKFKAQPSRRWLGRQPWAMAEWAAGRKVVVAIGYDADEQSRIRWGFGDPWEHARAVPWYPLHESGMTREDCVNTIRATPEIAYFAGLAGIDPVPVLSACTFCPNNSIADWQRLRERHPGRFAEALAMEERSDATVLDHESFGLMRPRPVGKKSLRVWAAEGAPCGSERSEMPCECAL